MTLTCQDLVTYLSDFLDGDLERELVEAARAHLATCQNCRVVLDSTRRMILLYREQGLAQTIPTSRKSQLFDQIQSAFSQSQSGSEGSE